jgi:glycosyltransferase involved in cell wall biosynthesis
MNNKKQNILIVTQYFWPENMRINDLAEGFVKKGHKVTVLTGLPNYPDGKIFSQYKENKGGFCRYKGAEIIRVPMLPRGKRSVTLMLNYLTFFLSASVLGIFKLRSRKFDAIFVYAVSPIMAAIPAIVIGRAKHAPVFLWVLDLWPDTLSAVGAVKNKYILKAVGWVVSWIYNRADYILFQSKSFKSNILRYCTRRVNDDRLVYFPSWSEDIIANIGLSEHCQLLQKVDGIFTVMFAGNLGEAQDFPSILNAFEQLKDNHSIRLVIVGDGLMLPWVKNEIKVRNLNNVILLGRHPVSDMPGLFSCADALLVSLKKIEIFSRTIPGKLQAYLATGKPIIGMVDGEAADVIRESGSGLVGPSGDTDALVKNLCALSELGLEERHLMGRDGVDFYNQHFRSTLLFDKLEQLFSLSTLRRKAYAQ